jgi:predicted GNAT family acetyltransferase
VEFTITDVPEHERFEAHDEAGEVAGIVTYQLTANIIVYTHTEVDAAYEGQGVGSKLAQAVMHDAKAKGRTVVPMCPFLSEWLFKHHEYDAIVARTTRRVK